MCPWLFEITKGCVSTKWAHLTRFKNLKQAFFREAITDSTHPGQATEWLAEIDQAESVQDLDNAEAVFGDYQMSFETLESQIAKGLVKIMYPWLKRT